MNDYDTQHGFWRLLRAELVGLWRRGWDWLTH